MFFDSLFLPLFNDQPSYRLKYCLIEPLNLEQLTNLPTYCHRLGHYLEHEEPR